MTLLLTVGFADFYVDCVDNPPSPPISLAQKKHLIIPKQSEISMTAEEMGVEANRKTLVPFLLLNSNDRAQPVLADPLAM